ncbi:MAG: biopolymer transporter ExbD [Myxococcaceae bacterium]
MGSRVGVLRPRLRDQPCGAGVPLDVFGSALRWNFAAGEVSGQLMRTRGGEAIEHDGELNTLPYLDVLMNLIIFMLLSMSGLATFGVINVTTSGSAPGSAGDDAIVHVRIEPAGFDVQHGSSAVHLASHDFAQLSAALATLKTSSADDRAVLSAAPDTSYELVTATLDAMRGAEGQRLFPDVALDR